ncbi:MAG: hypothetical protein IT450_06770 [Phycisphaerales bacterium]|nr:hypothetical protein [Phycisphaerales bacterium]
MKAVDKYEITAKFCDGAVAWSFCLLLEDGTKHTVDIKDGEEVPILMEICRRDWTVYYDAPTQTFSTGLNRPGSKETSSYSR